MAGVTFNGVGTSSFRPTGALSAVHIRPVGAGTGSVMFGSVPDALAIPMLVASEIAPAPPDAWTIENGVTERPHRILSIPWRTVGKVAFHVAWTLVAAVLAEGLHLWEHTLSLLGR